MNAFKSFCIGTLLTCVSGPIMAQAKHTENSKTLKLINSEFPAIIQSAALPYTKDSEIIEFTTDYEPPWGFLYEIKVIKHGVLTEYNFLGNGQLIEVETSISNNIPQPVLDEYHKIVPVGTPAEYEYKSLSVIDKDGQTVKTAWYEFDDVRLPDGAIIEVTISEDTNAIYIRKMKPSE